MRVGFGRRDYSVFRFVVGVGTEAMVVRKEQRPLSISLGDL